MATEVSDDRRQRERYVLLILAGMVVVVVAVALYYWLSRPPQMGTNEEVFKTVDALYTAVRSRDTKRLEECAARLDGYRKEGLLPKDAASHLDGIIRKARAGSWETATERLYAFMLAQRREGVIEHADHRHEKKHQKKSK